jgi:hypothetical protein
MNPRAPANPSKSRPSKSPWLFVAAFILVVALILFLRRTPPAPKPTVVPAKPPQSSQPPGNAFDHFLRATDLLQPPPRDTEFTDLLSRAWSGTWQDDERLTRYLEKNAPALTELERGLQSDTCKLPDYRNPESPVAYLESFRTLARLKSLQVKKSIAENHPASVLADAGQIVKFGDMIIHAGGPLIAYRTGVAIKHVGYDAVFHLLAEPGLNETMLRQLEQTLKPYRFDKGALAASLEVEHRAVGLWLLDAATHPNFDALVVGVSGGQPSEPVRTLLSGPPTFRLEETSNLMEQFFAMAHFNATHPWIEREPIERVVKAALVEPFDLRKESNAHGLVVLHLLFDQVAPTLIHQRRIEAEAAAAQAMCALAIYHRRHGNLPDSLADATPDLPPDPFSNQPFRYSRKSARLWSTGPDIAGDIAFTLEFAKPVN